MRSNHYIPMLDMNDIDNLRYTYETSLIHKRKRDK